MKRNSHAPIVNLDNWNYAFEHLSTVDLDGNPIIKPERTVRYEKQSQQGRNTTLVAGVRHDGRLVIDGINGQHVYVQLAASVSYGAYRLNNRQGFSVNGYETAIDMRILDSYVEDRLLYWLSISERADDVGNMPHKTLSVVVGQAQAQTAEGGMKVQWRHEIGYIGGDNKCWLSQTVSSLTDVAVIH